MKLSKIWGLPERQVLIYSMNKTEGETGSQNIGILPGPVFARNCVVWPQAGQFTFQMPLSCFLTCQRWSWFRKYLKSCAETRLLGHAGTHNFPHSLLLSMATWRALATEIWEEVIGSASQPEHESQVSSHILLLWGCCALNHVPPNFLCGSPNPLPPNVILFGNRVVVDVIS